MTYQQPRAHLHRSFLYLDHDAVCNALAMLEPEWAGRGTGLRGPAWPRRTPRTTRGTHRQQDEQQQPDPLRFAAFDAWRAHLEERHAIGTFDTWDESVRDQLEVGHTLRFRAHTVLTPMVKSIDAIARFAAGTRDPNSFLARDTASTERFAGPARKLESLLKEPDGTRRLSMYLEPPSGSQPRIVARVHERYLVTGQNQLDGDYEVIVQVEALLRHGETENIVRIMGSGPALRIETDAIAKIAPTLTEPARKLSVELTEGDITFTYPTVFVQPIAIYR